MNASSIGSVWSPFGLRDDPFFQQPLQPREDEWADRPITLFVGRDEELGRVGRQVVSSSSSRAIIQGDAGIGKTTFINRVKSEVVKHGVLTHADPVRVVRGMTPRHFLAEVLKTLLQIRATLATAESTGLLTRAKDFLSRESGATTEDRFWTRVGRIVEGEDSTAVGLTAAVVGAQRERVRIPGEVGDVSLHSEVLQALDYLTEASGRRVLIHVNNMENLSREDAASAAGLMQDLRNTFLESSAHWLFVGTTGIEDAIFRASDQVSGIIPFAITLGPLSADDVGALLELRYRHFQKGQRLIPPVSTEVAKALYARYEGHLRQFLSLLSNAAQRHAGHAPGIPLGAQDVLGTMATTLFEQLCRKIERQDAEYLRNAVRGMPFDAEFRVKEVHGANAMSQPAASKLVARLAAAGVIAHVRDAGTSTYYRVAHGDHTVALQMV